MGESDNIGNPSTPAEKAYGRSLPQPAVADFPIRGYEFYDYHHELDNDTFVNYQDNATRKTGAISYLLFTSFGMSSNNTVARSKFINAKPVYFPPIDNRWSNDDYGNTVYKTSVFKDKDGTITGTPNSYIVNVTGIDADKNCEAKLHLERRCVQGRCRAHECWRRWWRCWVRRLRRRRSSWRRWSSRCGRSSWWRRSRCRCTSRSSRLLAPPVLAQVLRSRCCSTCCCSCLSFRLPRWWSNQRDACTFRAASRSQPQRQGVHRRRGNQRNSGQRVQGDHRKAIREPHGEGAGCRFVGDVRAAGIHHGIRGYGGRAAWMRCATPAPRRTTRATVRFGSRSSPPVTSLAAALVAAPVPETACRSVVRLRLVV